VTDICSGRTVLITGGTGTLGRALCRHLLLNTAVAKVIIFSRDELKQSEMMRDKPYDDPRVRWFIGDVRDSRRLQRAFDGVDIVVHAAALKQIDACSYNPAEAVQTNVVGTMNVIDAALDRNVARVIAISTDKACEATTLYGKTKGCVEGLIATAGAYAGKDRRTRFACARYGNVFRSRGSVVPFFERMIGEGKALTVTHPDMTRFHLRIEDAVVFVLNCLARMQGGEIFVPKLPSYRVVDLVSALGQQEYAITGLRRQEKLAEAMIGSEEAHETRDHGDYFTIGGDGGTPVPRGFRYDSGSNPALLTVDELRAEIAR
jgi:UDP-N-acetylglucosamine 4,6-dehydratase